MWKRKLQLDAKQYQDLQSTAGVNCDFFGLAIDLQGKVLVQTADTEGPNHRKNA